MLTTDEADVGYRLLLVFSSMAATVATLLAIVGFFFEQKPHNNSGRYQMYSYLAVSVDIFIITASYLIPSCSIHFTDHKTFCVILGWAQFITEMITKFFTIGMSMFMLLSVSPGYRRCQCRGRAEFGRPVFLFWIISGLVYSVFFTALGAANDVIVVRDNRCWVGGSVGKIDTYMYQFVSYRILDIVTTAVALIYAILCSAQFKHMAKEHKELYLASAFTDEAGYKDAIKNLSALDKTLFHKFTAFVAVGVGGVIFSNSLDLIYNTSLSNTQLMTCFGWVDVLLVAIYFVPGFIFSKSFVNTLVRKTINTICHTTGHTEDVSGCSEKVLA